MLTNDCATVYTFVNGSYKRIFISDVFWYDRQQTATDKNGMTVNCKANVIIPADKNLALNLNAGKDMVCRGDIKFEFDNSSEQSQSQSLKELRSICGDVMSVAEFSKKFYGSQCMHHYEVLLK